MTIAQTRRHFLTTLSLGGAAALVSPGRVLAAQAPLESTAVRLGNDRSICIAPLLATEELLRADGFTDVQYVDTPGVEVSKALASAKVDLALILPQMLGVAIDAGEPITVLAGVHVGCFELFAREGIHSVADLKGKSVGLKYAPPDLLRLMAAHVGLDPKKDLRWVIDPAQRPMELFAEGKIDAFLGFPPEPQELRARDAGHVILSTAVDRPWSQYFCCMLAVNRDYIRKYSVATKRVLRAILKATDLCASEPALVAQTLVNGGFIGRFDYALQTLVNVPYNNWREYDAEDSVRFYALRMRDAGLIKSSPQKIIAEGTDWRFLDELKRELKA
jgi:NitT/TauT family transport system substrate-binding protein